MPEQEIADSSIVYEPSKVSLENALTTMEIFLNTIETRGTIYFNENAFRFDNLLPTLFDFYNKLHSCLEFMDEEQATKWFNLVNRIRNLLDNISQKG